MSTSVLPRSGSDPVSCPRPRYSPEGPPVCHVQVTPRVGSPLCHVHVIRTPGVTLPLCRRYVPPPLPPGTSPSLDLPHVLDPLGLSSPRSTSLVHNPRPWVLASILLASSLPPRLLDPVRGRGSRPARTGHPGPHSVLPYYGPTPRPGDTGRTDTWTHRRSPRPRPRRRHHKGLRVHGRGCADPGDPTPLAGRGRDRGVHRTSVS